MTTARKQLDLFEGIIPPDTPLGNFQCCQGPPPLSPLSPHPENPLDHYKRFGVTADQHVQALEWLSDNNQEFADLEDRQGELEEIGDAAGASAVQEQLDRIVADYLEHPAPESPAPLPDATEATEAPSVPSGQRLTWSGIAKGLAPWRQFRKGLPSERAQLENHLREKGWPYVAVDEAKKAIFNGSNIASFDFLVYSSTGPNLLVLVVTRRPTANQVEQMRQWEQVFGKDFLAAFTFQAGGQWRLVSLQDLQTPDPLACARLLEDCVN